MPQMKPMNWLIYLITFSTIIMMMNIMNFFIKVFNKNNLLNTYKKPSMNNWKW